MQLSLDAAMGHTFSVAEFSQLVNDVLLHSFPHDVWVQGEVRGITRAQSGHVYFDLVDASPLPGRQPDALLPVVLFQSTRTTVNAQIKRSGGSMRIDDGVAVRIRAVPNFYAPQGKLSLRMTGIDPAYTLGQMAASKEKLLAELAKGGLLDANKRRPFPVAPLRIGLVTADGSAAQADFLHELGASGISFAVFFAATPVQGAGAAHRIGAAIRACETVNVDIIAVVRGGGAKTDLAVFDDEVVARTIAAASVPVLTGIGHEIDTAVADHVAHLALKTPTACASHIAEATRRADHRATELWGAIAAAATLQLHNSNHRLTTAAQQARTLAQQGVRDANDNTAAAALRVKELVSLRLDRASARLSTNSTTISLGARHQLRDATERTQRAATTLSKAAPRQTASAKAVLDRAEDQVRLLDPARVLARGWSITTNAQGQVVRATTDLAVGQVLTTRVVDGSVTSRVTSTAPSGTSTTVPPEDESSEP